MRVGWGGGGNIFGYTFKITSTISISDINILDTAAYGRIAKAQGLPVVPRCLNSTS